jgi:hypothetical protein
MLKKRIISLLNGRDKQVPPIYHDSEIKAQCPQAIYGERERREKKKKKRFSSSLVALYILSFFLIAKSNLRINIYI